MGVDKISLAIANKLGGRLNKSKEEINVLNYGLFIMLHTSLTVIVTLIIGILTKSVIEIMVIWICSALLKKYSGGVHASSPMRCTIVGVSICTILACTSKTLISRLNNISLLLVLITVIIICYYVLYKRCPVGSKQKPLKNENKRMMLRKKSFSVMNIYLLIILILYLASLSIEFELLKTLYLSILFGAFAQVFSLSKIGGDILLGIDYMLSRVHQ